MSLILEFIYKTICSENHNAYILVNELLEKLLKSKHIALLRLIMVENYTKYSQLMNLEF